MDLDLGLVNAAIQVARNNVPRADVLWYDSDNLNYSKNLFQMQQKTGRPITLRHFDD